MTSTGADCTDAKTNAESMTKTKYVYVKTKVYTIENRAIVYADDELYASNRAVSKKIVECPRQLDEA